MAQIGRMGRARARVRGGRLGRGTLVQVGVRVRVRVGRVEAPKGGGISRLEVGVGVRVGVRVGGSGIISRLEVAVAEDDRELQLLEARAHACHLRRGRTRRKKMTAWACTQPEAERTHGGPRGGTRCLSASG